MTSAGPPEGAAPGRPTNGEWADQTAEGEGAYEFFQAGRRFLAERHPGQAAMYLERALRLAPDKNSIREALARAYFQLGRFNAAARLFRLITDAVPTNDYAHFALARCLLALDDVAGALRAARLAVAMAPDNADYRRALDDCLAAS